MAKRKSIADYESEWAAKDAARGETFVVPRKPSKGDVAQVVDPRSEIYSRTPIVNPSDEDYLKAYAEAGSEFLNMRKNAWDLGVNLGEKAYKYAVGTTPAQFREDLKKGHAAAFRAVPRALEDALRHPLGTLVELSPVGAVRAVVDAVDMSAQLRSLGDTEGASLAAKIAGPMGLMAALEVAPGVGAAGKGLANLVKRGAYTVAKDGAFRTVARRGVENEIVRMPEAAAASLPEMRPLAQDRTRSPLIRIADKHSMAAHGKPFDTAEVVPVSSLQRQAAVGRALREANTGNHAFEHAIYEGYGNAHPELIDQTGAQNYDQLREAAYNQLGKELGAQFDDLPLKLRYHDGPGEYASSTDMARDVLGNGQLNVFSGGDPHDFLGARATPATGSA